MGINLLKGMGKAYEAYKRNKASKKIFKKMKEGTSTRSERLQHGVRDKDIKSVPASSDVKKGDITESVRKGKQHFYIKNIDEVTKHKKNISKGKESVKKLKHMRDTKRAFKIGKTKTFPHDPAQGSSEWKKYK